MYDWDAVRRQLCGKEFQSQVHDARASHKQLWQAGWQRDGQRLRLGEYGSAWRCVPHRQPLGRAVLGVYAKHSGGETDSLRVTISQEQPVLA
jgi:hypothetical protein